MDETTITNVAVAVPSIEATITPTPTGPLQINSKVGAGAFAGALGVLSVWILGSSGIEVPAEPAVAIGTVYAFILGYIAKS